MRTVPEKKVIIALASELRGKVAPADLPEYRIEEWKGQKLIVMPCTFDTARVLHKGGIEWPAGPISYEYNWPGRYEPFAHQRITADLITWYKRCYVLNHIGTAKTLATLWGVDYLQRIGVVKRVLVCSTLSTLVRVWQDHLFHHFPAKSVEVLHGTKAQRLKRLAKRPDIAIINHEGIETIYEALEADIDIDMVIVDEGAEYCDARTNKYKVLHHLYGPDKEHIRVCWLTGSITPGGPEDFWAQARMIAPETVPKYFGRFRENVAYQVNEYKWLPRTNWQEYIASLAHPSVAFERSKCIDIPAMLPPSQRFIAMDGEQKAAYEEMRKQLFIEFSTGVITAVNEGVKRNKLLQISAGVVLDTNGEAHALPCAARITALKQTIREANNKIIIYASHRAVIDMLYKALSTTWSVGVVRGGVSIKERNHIFDDFQTGSLQIILAHPKTMAHGLTLVAARVAVFWGPAPSFRLYEQAIGRITRPGQKSEQTIVLMSSSPAEDVVFAKHLKEEEAQGTLKDILLSKL